MGGQKKKEYFGIFRLGQLEIGIKIDRETQTCAIEDVKDMMSISVLGRKLPQSTLAENDFNYKRVPYKLGDSLAFHCACLLRMNSWVNSARIREHKMVPRYHAHEPKIVVVSQFFYMACAYVSYNKTLN